MNPDRSDAPVGGRKKRSGNTGAFKEISDSFNAISVAEKVRLVKSLAGQVGLVALGPEQIARLHPSGAVAALPNRKRQADAAPSRWKNLPESVEASEAYKALRAGIAANGGQKLSTDHPLLVRYSAALVALKLRKQQGQTTTSSAGQNPVPIGSIAPIGSSIPSPTKSGGTVLSAASKIFTSKKVKTSASGDPEL